ncbi:uncharacterized protein LOC107371710 isoform X2 [Tetranychus urticae]|uniref:Uncharacterized protein n=1 Tax=Tetranychus urticae TaxID=32264 RepID=T1JXS8_TETUR|nr:uncharacterized protein LOC107371710 isoform X2 [Tetranychus urticae]
MAYFGTNRSNRSFIAEHHPCHLAHQSPTSSDCHYWEANGAINEAFSESSLNLSSKIPASSYSHLYPQQQLPQQSPSLFYVDDSSNWMDKSNNSVIANTQAQRYTEHWLDLEDSLNPVDGYSRRFYQPPSIISTNGQKSHWCSCRKICFYCVPLIVTLSLFGLIMIIATIIYLETYARQAEYSSNEFTSGRRPFDMRSSNTNLID